ncbi:glutamate synthase subunit beta [uncultured Dubosiella sp.]|uniref:glutamate synthase subunit beta n=1 Tax=uncultured Dubosiella sp. TaxID=1937011 RepID=UPI0025B54AA1|nr:glutamate synthase subunit beta [uncultured Dubosiella sp.]
MGKSTGFLQYGRAENPHRPVQARIKDFEELYETQSETTRKEQAARCMNCGVPFCQSAIELKGMVTGCPLHNLIPEWNDEIYQGNIAYALNRLLKTNPFPEFTGRVCPALCEKACINGLDGEPVCVHDNEKFIIESAFEQGLMKPRKPAVRSGKRVAVIGAGPSGLALANALNQRGHLVCVLEREEEAGGLLMYGIPNMKLDKRVIQRRVELMKEEGVTFEMNTSVGRDVSFDQLKERYDAIAVCAGAKKPRPVAGFEDDIHGVAYAVDFLSATTRRLQAGAPLPDLRECHVVIVGGGDTGNDCCATAIRLGCTKITQLEMMPEPPETRLESNPWPEWPKVKKTDYGQIEAIEVCGSDPRVYQTTIESLDTDEGTIKAVHTCQVRMTSHGPEKIEGTEAILPCDLLLVAAGFVGIEDSLKEAAGLETTPRNTIKTLPWRYRCQADDKLFAAGDARRGQSLVVWAIHEGLECAKEIDQFLMGYSNMES